MCIYIVALEKQTSSYQKVGKLVEKTGELGTFNKLQLTEIEIKISLSTSE